jgi:hypothetical protein
MPIDLRFSSRGSRTARWPELLSLTAGAGGFMDSSRTALGVASRRRIDMLQTEVGCISDVLRQSPRMTQPRHVHSIGPHNLVWDRKAPVDVCLIVVEVLLRSIEPCKSQPPV